MTVGVLAGDAPRAQRWRRGLRWFVPILLLMLLAWGVARWRARPGPVPYETVAVSRGHLEARVTATGLLSALVTVPVGSQVSGRIDKLLVDYNATVRAGQLLAQIDRRLFEAAVERSRAALQVARANLAKARAQRAEAGRQVRRTHALRSRRVAAEVDEETALTNREVAVADEQSAQAALAQAQAALHEAELNLHYTNIISPIEGTVISRTVDIGQTVAASFQAPQLFLIARDLRRMQVDSSIAEADVGHLAAGQQASFTVDAYPERTFLGSVRQVRYAATVVQNVVTYDAVIDVDNDALLLRPGMTANLTIVHARRDDALLVPNTALRFRAPTDWNPPPQPGEGRRLVWRLDAADKPQPVVVRVGLTDGNRTELLGDELSTSDRLVTELLTGARTGPGSYGRML